MVVRRRATDDLFVEKSKVLVGFGRIRTRY